MRRNQGGRTGTETFYHDEMGNRSDVLKLDRYGRNAQINRLSEPDFFVVRPKPQADAARDAGDEGAGHRRHAQRRNRRVSTYFAENVEKPSGMHDEKNANQLVEGASSEIFQLCDADADYDRIKAVCPAVPIRVSTPIRDIVRDLAALSPFPSAFSCVSRLSNERLASDTEN
jgi:hypothetical protein